MFIGKFRLITTYETYWAEGETLEEVHSELEEMTGDIISWQDIDFYKAKPIKVEVTTTVTYKE